MLRKWLNYTEKPPYGAVIDPDDQITMELVGCFLFNEYSGKACYDISNCIRGSFDPGAYWCADGVFLNYDSSNYPNIVLSRHIDLGSCNMFTIHALFRSTASGGYDRHIVFLTGLSGNDIRITKKAWETYAVGQVRVAWNSILVSGSSNINDGNKHTVSLVRVGDPGVELYVDSKLEASDYSTSIGYSPTNRTSRIGGYADASPYNWHGSIEFVLFFSRALSESEIERLTHEPYSFFLAPVPWFFIDLAAGQYSWNGNIPVSFIPSSVKEVGFYPQTGGAPIVITPGAEAQAAYKAQGEQNIALTPQGDIRAQYVEDGSVLVRLALAAEKQARFLVEGQVPLTLVPACEAQAAYEEAGDVPLALLPEASARASYAHQGEVPLALQVSADIACAFNVAGGLGLILLPQGTWTYVPVTGGAVYTWAGNIPVALVPDATVATTYEIEGQAYVELSLASEVATKYRHIGDLLLRLIPDGQASASWLIEGEIQLRLTPQGVAVLIKPSESEELFVIGVIEEDEIRAVFDDALHAKIWP